MEVVGQMDESKQILIAITELQANVKNLNAKMDEISTISKLALQTEQSAKSAHARIEDIKRDFERELSKQKEDYEEKIRDQKDNHNELKGHITWLWRAFGTGFISFLIGLIMFFMNK